MCVCVWEIQRKYILIKLSIHPSMYYYYYQGAKITNQKIMTTKN